MKKLLSESTILKKKIAHIKSRFASIYPCKMSKLCVLRAFLKSSILSEKIFLKSTIKKKKIFPEKHDFEWKSICKKHDFWIKKNSYCQILNQIFFVSSRFRINFFTTRQISN